MSDYTRKYGGSPVFRTSVGALAAGATTIIDYESDTFNNVVRSASRWIPLDTLRIINNSSVTIQVMFNQNPGDTRDILPAQDVTQPRKHFNSVTIKNLDSSVATTAGQVIVEAEKEVVTYQRVLEGSVRQAYDRGII